MKKQLTHLIFIAGLITSMGLVRAYSGLPSLKALPLSSAVCNMGGFFKTGDLDLDTTNRICKAHAQPLGNNLLKLTFAEPILLSSLKVAYSRIQCVDSIVQYFPKNGTKDMQWIEQAILKLKNGCLKNSN